jgi:hypothetical protein
MVLKLGLPDGLLWEGGKARGVGTGSQTRFLRLKINTKAAAEHKTTATKAEITIIAIMPPPSPSLCHLLCTSTPRGLFALALLSTPE